MRSTFRPAICAFALVGVAALDVSSPSAQVLAPLSGAIGVLQSAPTTTCSADSLATSPKLDAAVQRWVETESPAPLRVIVTAAPGLLSTVDALLLQSGALALGHLSSINATMAQVSARTLALLVCASSVATVSVDAVVRATAESSDESDSGGVYSLRATLGLPHDTPAGVGIGVAVIDSGIAPSADFGNRIAAFYDFTIGGVPRSPVDDYGHGTHVAGLIAASGVLSNGAYQGLGPQVKLVGLKVLDSAGAGSTSAVIQAIECAMTLRSLLGIQVINLSLGHPIYEPAARDPLVRAVETASRAGIVVVVAAGNYGWNATMGESGYGGITSPGNAPSALTVGAEMTEETIPRSDDRIAPYSSRGPSWYDGFAKPDIVAPGHHLISVAAADSTLVRTYPSACFGSYLRLSGTSMATAVASGAVALVLEAARRAHPAAPALSPNLVKAILEYSSIRVHDDQGVEYDDLTQGAGALNATGAVSLAAAIDSSQPAGSWWLTQAVTTSTTIASDTWSWSQRFLWRSQPVWGPAVFTNAAAWALPTAWGSDGVADSHFVWGTDVVWGSNEPVWSSTFVWGTNVDGASTGEPNADGSGWGSLASTPDPPSDSSSR